MKNNFEQEYKSYKDYTGQLETDLANSHKSIIENTVKPEARRYGENNLPGLDDHSLTPYLTSVRASYRQLQTDIRQKLKGKLQDLLAAATIPALTEKINAVAGAIKDTGTAIRNYILDREGIRVNSSLAEYQKNAWIIFISALGECVLNMSSVLKLGEITILSAIIGAVFGYMQVYAVRTAVLHIREIANARIRRMRFWLAVAGFILVSLIFGTLRYHFIHTGPAAGIPFLFLNPFTFAVLNMFLVAASALLVHHFYPSLEDIKKLEHIKEYNGKIEKLTKDGMQLQKAHDALVAERRRVHRYHEEVKLDEKLLFGKIAELYDEAVGTFKLENFNRRTDGKYPDCFKRPHEPLNGDSNKHFDLTT